MKSNPARSKYASDGGDESEDEKGDSKNASGKKRSSKIDYAGATSAIKEISENNDKMFRKFKKQMLRSNKMMIQMDKEILSLNKQIMILKQEATKSRMRNKDDFEARVKAIFREPKKTRIKAAIFFIGIDNIRQLKNTFGQAAAKRILQIVENEISHYCNEFIETSEIPNISIKTFKSYESTYRVEYNLIFCGGTNVTDSQTFARELRNWIEATCKATISIGVSYWNNNDHSSHMWKQRANYYLRNAKSNSKNAVMDDNFIVVQKDDGTISDPNNKHNNLTGIGGGVGGRKHGYHHSKHRSKGLSGTFAYKEGSLIFDFEHGFVTKEKLSQLEKINTKELLDNVPFHEIAVKYFGNEARVYKLELQIQELVKQNMQFWMVSNMFSTKKIVAFLERLDFLHYFNFGSSIVGSDKLSKIVKSKNGDLDEIVTYITSPKGKDGGVDGGGNFLNLFAGSSINDDEPVNDNKNIFIATSNQEIIDASEDSEKFDVITLDGDGISKINFTQIQVSIRESVQERSKARELSFIHNPRYTSVRQKANASETLVCNFKINHNFGKHDHGESTIILKPFISTFIQNAARKKLIPNQDREPQLVLNEFGYYENIANQANMVRHTLKIRLTESQCGHVANQNGGHRIRVGIIAIPTQNIYHRKTLSSTSGNSNKSHRSNSTSNGGGSSGGINSGGVGTGSLTQDDTFKLNVLTQIGQTFSRIRFKQDNCSIDNLLSQDVTFKKFETYYISFIYNGSEKRHVCRMGKNNNPYYIELFFSDKSKKVKGGSKLNEEYCLKRNDYVEICVDYNQDNDKAWLYFTKNSDFSKVIGKNVRENEFKFGKIELDFDKYDYLYAFSSARCGCNDKDIKGFEFEVSV